MGIQAKNIPEKICDQEVYLSLLLFVKHCSRFKVKQYQKLSHFLKHHKRWQQDLLVSQNFVLVFLVQYLF